MQCLPAIHSLPLHLLQGRRCALLTNDAACDAAGVRCIEALRERGVELTLLLSPEHGLSGMAQAGEAVGDGVDAATGLPVASLYGKDKRQIPSKLWNDFYIMLLDLPDVGVRYFTYADTVLRVLEQCASRGRPAILLDRPNPLGRALEGPVLERPLVSEVGCAPVPVRHGMTLGEYVTFAARERGLLSSLDLTVVPPVISPQAPPDPLFPDFGTPWRRPSPNLPSFPALCCYPGTCLFEGTNLSEGRGTPTPGGGRPFPGWGGAPGSPGAPGIPRPPSPPCPFCPPGQQAPGSGLWGGGIPGDGSPGVPCLCRRPGGAGGGPALPSSGVVLSAGAF